MTDLTIRPCTTQDVDATADMLAHAFEVDEAYRYLMPNAATRTNGLRGFFAGNLRVHLAHRCTQVMLDAEQRVIATVTLRPPGGIHISGGTMLRHGLLPFAFSHGVAAVKRMFWLKAIYDDLEANAAQRSAHWYVHMMAVHPEHQGQGLGSQLLRHVLDAAHKVDANANTVLTTHLQANVTYYRRAGFEITDQRTLTPPGSHPYTVWSMRK